MRAYVDEATNAAASAERTMNGMLKSSEEALRAAWRMAVVAPLFGGASGGLFGGLIAGIGSFFSSGGASSGGSVPVPDTGAFAIAHSGGLIGLDRLQTGTYNPAVFVGAPKYHGGGLVAGERPIVARVGEGVFTPRQMDNADRLLGAALSQPAAAVNVHVTVHNTAAGTEAKAQWSQGADGNVQVDVFVEEIENRLNRRIGRGEGMAPVLEHRYGLNPAAGAYR